MTESTSLRSSTGRTPTEALKTLDKMSRRNRNVFDTVDVLGVVGGVKPMALLFGRTDMQPLLHDMGLVTHLETPKRPESGRPPTVFAAKDPQVIEEYKALAELKDADETHRQLGRLLGYPETATDYFLRRSATLYTDDELPMIVPEWLQGTVHGQLHQFVLSPEHYEKEIATYIDPLHDAVKEYGLHTYRALEDRARSVRRRKATQRILNTFGIRTKSGNNFPMQMVKKR